MNTNDVIINKEEPKPWGFFATIGLSLAVIAVLFVIHTAVTFGFVVAAALLNVDIDPYSLESNGLLLSIATLLTTPSVIALSLLFAKLRKGITIREYFCFYRAGKDQYIRWILACILLVVCSDSLNIILEKPVIPDFVINAYLTAYFTPLLWFALIIAAPLGEEIVFRGFLFKGLQHSKVGPVGAIVLSSLIWSSLHMQYDLYVMATIFVGGILLGFARLKTNSIYVPIAMHALWSLIATIEAAVYIKHF